MVVRPVWYVVAAFLAIGLMVAAALWTVSPGPSAAPGTEVVNGRTFAVQSESLFGSASWLNYTFHGVVFGFHLWCATTPAAGTVCGNATEPDGTSYPYAFADGPPQEHPAWQTWIAPDGREGVQYLQGGSARLLVAE